MTKHNQMEEDLTKPHSLSERVRACQAEWKVQRSVQTYAANGLCVNCVVAFLALVKAVDRYIGQSGTNAFVIAENILAMRDALAHPAIQRAVTEMP